MELPDASVEKFLEIADGVYDDEEDVRSDLSSIITPAVIEELIKLRDSTPHNWVQLIDKRIAELLQGD